MISTQGGGIVASTSQQAATDGPSRDADSQHAPRKLVYITLSTWKPKEEEVLLF